MEEHLVAEWCSSTHAILTDNTVQIIIIIIIAKSYMYRKNDLIQIPAQLCSSLIASYYLRLDWLTLIMT